MDWSRILFLGRRQTAALAARLRSSKPGRPPAAFLFSGHMIDRRDRPVPRFPEAFSEVAGRAIRTRLEALGGRPGDVGLCGGACGGDLLFAEACLDLGMDVELLLHDRREVVLEESVAFAGQPWVERFERVAAHARCTTREMPAAFLDAAGGDRFVASNIWRLEAALAAADGTQPQLVALWDGRPGDRPGGTAHMCDLVEKARGLVHVIPSRRLAQARAIELLTAPGAISAAEALGLLDHLKREKQFEFGHALLAKALENPSLTAEERVPLRQERAQCLYKDPDLAPEFALSEALKALTGPDAPALEDETDKETLGIAGAIYKRWWEVDGERSNLERACSFYEKGYAQELALRAGDGGLALDWYAGINAAYVRALLAVEATDPSAASGHQAVADTAWTAISTDLQRQLTGITLGAGDWWRVATLVEGLFGLGRFDEARGWLAAFPAFDVLPAWQLESTARQLAAVGALSGRRSQAGDSAAGGVAAPFRVLQEFGLDPSPPSFGRVGLALSGGGFRAAFFQIGHLAKLAEADLLRHVEVISCVSGGSILGAYYYLELRELLQRKPDAAVTRDDYIEVVKRMEVRFLEGVQTNIRRAVFRKALLPPTRFSQRTRFAAELFEERLYALIDDGGRGYPRLLRGLVVQPMTDQRYPDRGFNPKVDNWRRRAKVPILVINATTLNSGHNWQFTATWMGEPPTLPGERFDANPRLRRVYLSQAPAPHGDVRLGTAVAASACVPGVFAPVALRGLFPRHTVQLVDGGVHDNQGIGALLREDCTVLLISDGSGQMGMSPGRPANPIGVMQRSSSVMGFEMRRRWFRELNVLERARRGQIRLLVHLKLGLPFQDIGAESGPEAGASPSTFPGSPAGAGASDSGPAEGLPDDLQQALSQLRTDLDSFSEDEAQALMLSGYRMTGRQLATLGVASPGQAPPLPWAFRRLETIVDGRPGSRAYRRLLGNLETGRIGLFRGPRRALARLGLR
ncbi:MAG: patatin-like phospholipase family protein [Dehalococcoidia bacterium]